jgi:hypothetical protein
MALKLLYKPIKSYLQFGLGYVNQSLHGLVDAPGAAGLTPFFILFAYIM